MLIRVRGYNAGAQEYLEKGTKSRRQFTRDELDHRVIIDGDLDLTRLVYESIEDKGQDRYLSFTLAFREDDISNETLAAITQEFKQFMMYAYREEEYNFYAEAHLPKIKSIADKKTGEMIERKPHLHIIIPKKNLLSRNIFDPVGSNYAQSEKHLEAFQEYINQKYKLASPRDHIRADIRDAASVLSRYNGDDFYGKNRQMKQNLVKQVIERGINTREDFYALVATIGETKIRNQGKPNEYIAVKAPGDAKFTNLKDTIFSDDFIVRRELKKAPLDPKVIADRLLEWPQRAKEIKYISKAGPDFRQVYVNASPEERTQLLKASEARLYQAYGDRYDSVQPTQRKTDRQRRSTQAQGRSRGRATDGLQNVPVSHVADHRQAGSARGGDGAVLLPSDAHLHLGQPQPGGDSGLRPSVPTRGGRGRPSRERAGRRGEPSAVPSASAGKATQGAGGRGARSVRIPRTARGARVRGVIPPYAQNPYRVANVKDIEQRARMLFDPLKRPAEKPLVFKRAPITALTANKHASTVAAYFTREAQYNQILPAHRHALRRLDQQFYSTRRAVFSDDRLTRQDKAQLMSVLTFERLRAREQLQSPQPSKEVDLMGSAAIRELIEDEKEEPGFTISGAKGPSPEGVRDRVKRIMDRFAKQVDPQAAEERARDLSAKDLYTKKAKFSQNVHYLDKATDKTLFVDTGKAISMRRTGITESGVAVALELAKERFGSTLTINGTADFKKMVIEAAVKNGLDVHFTDKAMNQGLAARRAELAIEKEGQSIGPGVAPAPDVEKPAVEQAAAPETTTKAPAEAAPTEAATPAEKTADPDLQSPSELVRREAQYRQNMGMKEADVHASDTIMSLRGEDHAMWLIGTGDSTPEAAAMLTAYMERDHYREAFKETIEAAYRQVGDSPEALKALDEVTGMAEKIVNEVEGRLRMAEAPATAPAATAAATPTANAPEGRSRVIEGELIDHGAARYQHQDDKQMSYFVTLKTDAGERTVWGVGLEEAMNSSDLARGDQVRLEDHGTRPVLVQEVAEDGTVKEKMTNRREWSAEPALAEREVADTTTKGLAVAAGTPDLPEPEQEADMNSD